MLVKRQKEFQDISGKTVLAGTTYKYRGAWDTEVGGYSTKHC